MAKDLNISVNLLGFSYLTSKAISVMLKVLFEGDEITLVLHKLDLEKGELVACEGAVDRKSVV